MRPEFALAACITTLAVAVVPTLVPARTPEASAQTPQPGRIVGRVTDRQGSELSNVQVTLTGDGVHRSVAADAAGRFVFDALDAERLYTVRAELPGFKEVVRDGVAVGSGETVTLDFSLRICLGFAVADHVISPLLDELLTAAAVVHLRIAETGHRRLIETDAYCGEVVEAPATILEVGRLSHDEWRSYATIALTSDDVAPVAGAEYLAFLTYNTSTQQFSLDEAYAWKVSGGRVDGLAELGIRDGTPIAQALTKLRETYSRHTRYRQYDDLTPTAPLETLHYKTGWLALGTLALDRDAWTDGYGVNATRPFDFVANPEPSRNLPRPTDRIRLKEGGPITILDYGSRGEGLRNRSPTTRPRGGHVTDLTGTRVDAGGVYAVADVRLERLDDLRLVWVRLVAAR
jgi:hypothetical protein